MALALDKKTIFSSRAKGLKRIKNNRENKMKKRLYQSPELNLNKLIFETDVIMASSTVVDPITNGGNYDGGNYA